jgi:NADP-dependent 3-hydroxy acid dehydrogenase YdfG
MGKLDGKVALVTGSGRNIGRATVLKLAGEGAHVVVNARSNQAEADAVVREAKGLGVKAIAVVADVASKDQVEAMAARALSEFGRVDILVNNAAIRPHKPFTELTAQDWEAVRGVVLDGALYLTRAVIESMVKNKYGRILFFTGEGAFVGGNGRAHVSAAKMGLVGFARAGVRVRSTQHPGQRGFPRQHRYGAGKSRMVPGTHAERRGHSTRPPRQGGRDRRHLPVPGQRRWWFHHRPDDPCKRRRRVLLIWIGGRRAQWTR